MYFYNKNQNVLKKEITHLCFKRRLKLKNHKFQEQQI